jgi:hypothetical protein
MTLTFNLETWFMHVTLLLIVVNISMKFHQNYSMRVGHMLLTKIGHCPPYCLSNCQEETIIQPIFQTYKNILQRK